MNHLGFGVMINWLGGNEESVNALKSCLGKKISTVKLDEEKDSLNFTFDDSTKLSAFDDGQSCCESRYMRTDDDLSYYSGSIFMDAEIRSAADIDHEWGQHEIQFLNIVTDRGVFTMSNHNEHNGYYGGFSIKFELK